MNRTQSSNTLARMLLALALLAGLLHTSGRPALAASQIDIPGPAGSGQFGGSVTVLPNGNFVVVDTKYNGGIGANAGAAYLYNGATGAMISMLTGSAAGDLIGNGGVFVLANGNYVVRSPSWANGGAAGAGAATWGSAVSGVSGPVTAANSLVGSTAGDQVGASITPLTNGNYVVQTASWDNGGILDAGAVTWGNGNGGTVGPVTAANSLVGGTASDQIGNFLKALTNGNYVVGSILWDDGAIWNAGAATWGNGTIGTAGPITAANSLVGGTAGDQVGLNITVLSNGNYVVLSSNWDNGAISNAGAATWGNGNGGTAGLVSAANSLVGNKASDGVGNFGAVPLANGNYVVRSILWDNGAIVDAGAVTWGNGNGGTTGLVTAANSLVGSTASDQVGTSSVVPLSNGNYVVASRRWDNAAIVDAGAVTWGNGNGGTAGPITAANSLVGGAIGDSLGVSSVVALSNGNYVALSPNWDNGGVADAGAATWGNGNGGTVGLLSALNSLVGGADSDQVGAGVTALTNGNYVVRSPGWDNGPLVDAGAATWGDGNGGTAGPVSALNSLVGSAAADLVSVSGAFGLANGNYVVASFLWDNGGIADAGAATWGDGNGGTVGPVTALNSLVGSTASDQVGSLPIAALSNGDYVVASPLWDNGGLVNAGAVAWGDGTTGTTGPVTALNSLVGSTANDLVGQIGLITPLANGTYVVPGTFWDNGGATDAGAFSWGFGPGGSLAGPITAANSVRGSTAGGGLGMNFKFDPVNHQLVVGRMADNTVTLFRLSFGVTVTPPADAKIGAPGATVNYTLQVTNTGDAPDTFDLAASGESWTTNLPAAVGPLAPGESQDVTVSVTVPAGAAGGSSDAATVSVTSQADNTQTDSAVLTTSAADVFGVTVTPPADAKSGAPGATVNYTLQVANTGNTPATFDVAASGNAWTTNLPATVGPIAAGASQNVNVSVTVPAAAAGGSSDTATVTVTSQADNTKTDSAVLTTGAANIFGVTVTPPADAKSGAPGATVNYTLQVANTGNTPATFDLAASGNAWTTNLPATVGPVAAGASQSITVSVTVPAGAAGGSSDAATVSVTSQSDNTKTDSAVLTTGAADVFGVTVTPPADAKSGAPGATVNYTLQVTNTGNAAETFDVTISGQTWTVNHPATVGPLAPGASQGITVSVVIPASAAGGSSDAVTVTVTLQASGAIQDSAVLTTTVTAPSPAPAGARIYMPIVRK